MRASSKGGGGVFSSTVRKNRCMKFIVTSSQFPMKKMGFICLTFSFTSFKIEYNPLTIRHATVSKQLSTANNIFKVTASTFFNVS